jgi:hypothetical protein
MVWWTAIPAATRAIYQGTKWVKQIKKLKKGEGSTVTKVQSGTKPKKKLTNIEQADKDAFAATDKFMGILAIGTGAAAYSDYKKSKKRKDTRRKSKPHSQKTPVRGIQLGAPGTQSGTSRSKKGY